MIASRFAACIVFGSFSCVLVSCKPAAAPNGAQNQTPGGPSVQTLADARHQPSTAELANFILSTLPPVLKLVDVKNDPPVPMPNTPPGSNVWIYNVRLTFAPVEDELGSPPPQDAQAFQSAVDELNGLVGWSQAYARSPYASLYPGFTVSPPVPASPKLLRVLHPKDRPLAPIYGRMAAEWQVDHWQFSVENLAMPADEGHFRSTFSGPVFIQGDPATDQFLTTTKAAIAQAKSKRDAIERNYQEDLRKATQPGTIYKGQISHGSSTMPAEVRFTAPPSGDPSFAQFELRLPASGFVYTCSARLAKRVPNLPSGSASTDDSTTGIIEPTPRADMTISYQKYSVVKFNPNNLLANDFMYNSQATTDAPLSVLNHQLRGKVASVNFNPFVLSAQENP